MYRSGTNSITMWKLSENTVAGDLGVTVFIQVSICSLSRRCNSSTAAF
jgi:hypothetical protein